MGPILSSSSAVTPAVVLVPGGVGRWTPLRVKAVSLHGLGSQTVLWGILTLRRSSVGAMPVRFLWSSPLGRTQEENAGLTTAPMCTEFTSKIFCLMVVFDCVLSLIICQNRSFFLNISCTSSLISRQLLGSRIAEMLAPSVFFLS